MRLTGKTREEVIEIMSDQHLEESNESYLVYSIKIFLFITRKTYIEFNENGIADTVYTH